MDAELVKASVPVARLAARLRAMRRDLRRPRIPGHATPAVAYDALQVEVAAMVEADVPPRRRLAPGGGWRFDSPSPARAEEARARAGVDLGLWS